MKTLLAATALVLLAAATACSSAEDQVAVDPPATSPVAEPLPPAPVPPGPVSTRGLVTVVDRGEGPQVCLGVTTQVLPPTCTGPALVGWRWDGGGERSGGTRYGSYALTGTWDGTELSVISAIPAALYDAAPTTPDDALPAPATSYDVNELAAAAQRLADLPGALGATPDDQGHVLVDTTYDDGSLQAWADAAYGAGVVAVTGELVDAG